MAESEKESFGTKCKVFFKGLKSEFKKIIWPTREDLTKQTIAVIVVSVILGLLIAALDAAFQFGFTSVIK
jgi:preprotein translocase subunit SecE